MTLHAEDVVLDPRAANLKLAFDGEENMRRAHVNLAGIVLSPVALRRLSLQNLLLGWSCIKLSERVKQAANVGLGPMTVEESRLWAVHRSRPYNGFDLPWPGMPQAIESLTDTAASIPGWPSECAISERVRNHAADEAERHFRRYPGSVHLVEPRSPTAHVGGTRSPHWPFVGWRSRGKKQPDWALGFYPWQDFFPSDRAYSSHEMERLGEPSVRTSVRMSVLLLWRLAIRGVLLKMTSAPALVAAHVAAGLSFPTAEEAFLFERLASRDRRSKDSESPLLHLDYERLVRASASMFLSSPVGIHADDSRARFPFSPDHLRRAANLRERLRAAEIPLANKPLSRTEDD